MAVGGKWTIALLRTFLVVSGRDSMLRELKQKSGHYGLPEPNHRKVTMELPSVSVRPSDLNTTGICLLLPSLSWASASGWPLAHQLFHRTGSSGATSLQ